jgi:hypothetical protein
VGNTLWGNRGDQRCPAWSSPATISGPLLTPGTLKAHPHISRPFVPSARPGQLAGCGRLVGLVESSAGPSDLEGCKPGAAWQGSAGALLCWMAWFWLPRRRGDSRFGSPDSCECQSQRPLFGHQPGYSDRNREFLAIRLQQSRPRLLRRPVRRLP